MYSSFLADLPNLHDPGAAYPNPAPAKGIFIPCTEYFNIFSVCASKVFHPEQGRVNLVLIKLLTRSPLNSSCYLHQTAVTIVGAYEQGHQMRLLYFEFNFYYFSYLVSICLLVVICNKTMS